MSTEITIQFSKVKIEVSKPDLLLVSRYKFVSGFLLREALITSRTPQMWMSVCPSVRPSVCVCVCVCVTDFCDFCEGHMASEHPQIPFAKRAQKCPRTHLKIYPRILGLNKSKISDHFFDKKRVFTKKVPSFTRCKNVWKSPKSVLSDSAFLVGIDQKVLFSSWDIRHINVSRSHIRHMCVTFSVTGTHISCNKASRHPPAGCCLV